MGHLELTMLRAGLAAVRTSPVDDGRVELIVRRPAEDQRELLHEAELRTDVGLVGDRWSVRTDEKAPNPEAQLTLMNARAAALVAGRRDHGGLAGDQLYVDLDLSTGNLPAGTRLAIGSAVVEVTAEPHTGCGKFARRFGVDALKFVNSKDGRALNLRGINTRVIAGGRPTGRRDHEGASSGSTSRLTSILQRGSDSGASLGVSGTRQASRSRQQLRGGVSAPALAETASRALGQTHDCRSRTKDEQRRSSAGGC
jgi:hypothetical protein